MKEYFLCIIFVVVMYPDLFEKSANVETSEESNSLDKFNGRLRSFDLDLLSAVRAVFRIILIDTVLFLCPTQAHLHPDHRKTIP